MSCFGGGQHLGEVDRLDRQFLSLQVAGDLHQAARIAGHDVFGAGARDGGALHLVHRVGDHRELHRERSAEAATGFRFLHLDQLKPAHLPEQLPGFVLESQFAQRVAGIVVSDFGRELRADVGDAEFVDEELGQLEGGRWIDVEFGIEIAHHRRAGAGRADDGVIAGEDYPVTLCQWPCFVPVTCVEGGLAAAGLFRWIIDIDVQAAQHLDHGDADVGEELIHEAGDEQGDAHRLERTDLAAGKASGKFPVLEAT